MGATNYLLADKSESKANETVSKSIDPLQKI